MKIGDLKKSIFLSDYFESKKNCLSVRNNEEKDKKGEAILDHVNLTSKGDFISLNNSLLKKSNEIFSKENAARSRISFRRECDGICFLELEGKRYLLLIEVKSGFNEIKNKGLEQLVASYVRVRCLLNTISAYCPEDYEEKAIIVSYPYCVKPITDNKEVLSSKTGIVLTNEIKRANNDYSAALKVDGHVTVDLKRYNVDKCCLRPTLVNPTIDVSHCVVETNSVSANIDIDSFL